MIALSDALVGANTLANASVRQFTNLAPYWDSERVWNVWTVAKKRRTEIDFGQIKGE